MLPDEPTEEEKQQELPEDNGTPFQPADDTTEAPAADDTHPATDTSVDSDQLYQEGVTEATNAPAPVDPSVELEDVSEVSEEEEAEDPSAGSPS